MPVWDRFLAVASFCVDVDGPPCVGAVAYVAEEEEEEEDACVW